MPKMKTKSALKKELRSLQQVKLNVVMLIGHI